MEIDEQGGDMANRTPSDPTAGTPEALYAQLKANLGAEEWIEAIAICHRILQAEPEYRDVSELLTEARRRLAQEREESRVAAATWRDSARPTSASSQQQRRRWSRWLLVPAVAVIVAASVLAASVARRWWPSSRSELSLAANPTDVSSQVDAGDMALYVNTGGRFLVKYPQGWTVEESPPENQSLQIVFITSADSSQPARIAIFYAPGSGQSAEQVWVSVLGLVQAMQDEDAENWQLGEATSVSIGGYHARQIPFRYTRTASGTVWRGLIVGLVQDSTNYAFILESPLSLWPQVWPLFDEVLDSTQFP